MVCRFHEITKKLFCIVYYTIFFYVIFTRKKYLFLATLGLERNDKPKALPIHSLIMADGKEVPIGQHNSVTLPARFVLELNDEMPLESSKCQDIINITGIDFLPSNQKATPMLQLVTKQNSNGVLDSSNNRGLFVVSFRFIYYYRGSLSYTIFETEESPCNSKLV